MYLDQGSRRKHRGDKWTLIGGVNGGSYSKQHGVQRSYGTLMLYFGDDDAPRPVRHMPNCTAYSTGTGGTASSVCLFLPPLHFKTEPCIMRAHSNITNHHTIFIKTESCIMRAH